MPRERYVNPFEPADVYAALGRLLALVKSSSELAPEERLWLTHGLRAVRERPGVGLDEALGLRPGRGERWFNEQWAKFELIRAVGEGIEGEPMWRAEQIAAVLRGEASPRTDAAAAALKQLQQVPSFGKSPRTVLRALAT